MRIYNQGHTMKYENECVATLFFPGEKLETVALDLPPQGEFCPPEGDWLYTGLFPREGGGWRVQVQVSLAGENRRQEAQVSSQEPPDERERVMAYLLYQCLSGLTGLRPAWGILTGVRPVKLFHKRLDGGKTPEETAREFMERFLVSPEKADLALRCAAKEGPILRQVRDDSFSLYVSVPFCPSRCSYCSFVSQAIATKKSRELLPRYTDALCRELEEIARLARQAGLTLTTVYFGGGTPTTLEAGQLEQLCRTVQDCFDLGHLTEYTVEAGRPDTIDREKLEVLHRYGVDRISINPQTFNDEVLREIGRSHTAQEAIQCYQMAREVGFGVINMDLIAGLPGETQQSFASTVDRVVALAPENVTVHTLCIKRSSQFGETPEGRRRALEPARLAQGMVGYAQEKLLGAGYSPYYLYKQRNTLGNLENTGYCKPGCEGRYNIYIMDESQTILAAGGGAVTKLRSNRTGALERVFNYKYPFEYLEHFEEILRRKERVVSFYEENPALPVRKD